MRVFWTIFLLTFAVCLLVCSFLVASGIIPLAPPPATQSGAPK